MAKARRRGSSQGGRRGGRRVGTVSDHTASPSGREHFRADGTPKARFDTVDDANRVAFGARLESGADLDPYLCGFCRGWHLGNPGRG